MSMRTGDLIRNERTAQDLSQEELGAKMGVTYRSVYMYESGRRVPKLSTLKRFADALGVPVRQLMGDDLPPVESIHEALNNHDAVSLETILGGKVEIVGQVDLGAERKLITVYRQLSKEKRELVLQMMEAMLNG